MSPGSGTADGAVGSRALSAASDDDTNASFRTESQSFLHEARKCGEWPDNLLGVAHMRRNTTTASARRSALRWIKPSYRSLAGAPSVLLSTFLICSNGDIAKAGVSNIRGTPQSDTPVDSDRVLRPAEIPGKKCKFWVDLSHRLITEKECIGRFHEAVHCVYPDA
jgi:hypothetical protein